MPVPPQTFDRVDRLVRAVQSLPDDERREFQRRLAEGQRPNGVEPGAAVGLPPAAERALQHLTAKSERGELSPEELTEYQRLAAQARQVDVARAEALAETARRGEPPAPKTRKARKGRGGSHGT